ncbi:MAG: nickel-binding protein [Polyangiales bacterium]
MNQYAILRRNGWKTPDDLHAAAGRSKHVGDTEMQNDVRWIRTYVIAEPDGTLGTLCVYEATSPEAITKHANRAELALSEIRPIVDTVLVRPDPVK